MINTHEEDPNSLFKIRVKMQELSEDSVLLSECLGYLIEALETCEIAPEPADQSGRALFERLQILDLAEQLSRRVIDLKKNLTGAAHELETLGKMTNDLAEVRLFKANEAVAVNTHSIMMQSHTQEQSRRALELLVVLITGLLSFEILSRLTGTWSLVDPNATDLSTWIGSSLDDLLFDIPAAWFGVNLILWLLIAYGIIKHMRNAGHLDGGALSMRMKVHARLNMSKWNKYLRAKTTALEHRSYENINHIVKLDWHEADTKGWAGFAPHVTVEYDESTGYLLYVTIRYNKRKASKKFGFSARELREKLSKEFQDAHVFAEAFLLLDEQK